MFYKRFAVPKVDLSNVVEAYTMLLLQDSIGKVKGKMDAEFIYLHKELLHLLRILDF